MIARALLTTISRKLPLGGPNFWLNEIDPTWSLTETRARVVEVINETDDVQTFVLAPNILWPGHRAGQFVPVSVEIDGVRVSRCYSLSSAPNQKRLAITVKRVAAGRVSSWMHAQVAPGDVLTLGRPGGDFVLPSQVPAKLLLISGGSGITPVMSILRDLASKNAVGDVVFVHAARSKSDVIFARELETLATLHPRLRVEIFTEHGDGPNVGRMDRQQLEALVPDVAERETFLCGPAPMMDALALIWENMSIRHRLLMERFAGPTAIVPASSNAQAKVRLSLLASKREVEINGASTLLESLESQGETPAYGCRMGICNTCVCRKRSGVVENIHTGALSSEPDEDIRLCVSRARTNVELAF